MFHATPHLPTCSCAASRQEPALAGSLSRALCFIQAHWGGSSASREAAAAQGRPCPRLLCLSASADAAAQYISVMNAIFAAQVCHP